MKLAEIRALAERRGLRFERHGWTAWRISGRGVDIVFSEPRSVHPRDFEPCPEPQPGFDREKDDRRAAWRWRGRR